MPSLQTLEGVWWKHDPGVGGFLSLTNTTGAAVTVGVQVLGAHGLTLPKQSINLGPHAAQMLDLASLTAALPGLENQEGGIRIQYQGMMGDVIPVGGLENDSEGYSPDMPIWPHNPARSNGKKSGSPSQGTQEAGMTMPSPVAWTLGAVGIMTGYPDPAMGFPGGTHFTPYVTLRNTSSTPLTLTPALYLANSGQSKAFPMPRETLAPYETRQIDMAKAMKKLGLADFSGNINLTYSFMGQAGDLIMAPGSVDQTGNYVFQVLAQSVNPGWAKDVPAWTIANGYDTMFTLWNPSNAAEDLMATFYFADGSGQYQMPIHLEAGASMNLDMAQLLALNEPDAQGHTFPAGTSGGSVEFSSPKGMNTMISLSVGAAEFNVENGTCSSCCVCCGGISQILICPNPGYCPIQVPEPMYAEVYFTNGGSADITNEANWSTGNGTIATVGNTRGANKGVVTGHAVGSTTLSAQFTSTMAALYCICNGYCYTRSSGSGSGQANVTPTILLGGCSGTNITGQTKSAVTGQQINLCGSYALPSGVSVSSQSWSVGGTTVGGWTVGPSSGGYSGTNFAQQSTTFYWLAQGSGLQVKFTVNLSNGSSGSATATYNISGPTGVSLSPNPPSMGNWQISSGPDLQLGSNITTPHGITFNASATSPSGDTGTYEYAQIVTTASGTTTSGSTQYNCSTTIGLDTRFPYDTGLTPAPNDSPYIGLDSSSYSKQTFSFGATMYLMWDPGLTNSIPVPLGHVAWQAYGDATFSNSNWTIQSDSSRSAGSFQASTSGPSWTSVFKASNGLTCQ